MSDEAAAGSSGPPRSPSRWTRLRRFRPSPPVTRILQRGAIVVIALVAAAVVSFVTIDLGPSVRAQAERAASGQLDRRVTIGRLGTYLLPGRFVIEDLRIDGLRPGDDPFFTCERIVVSTSWLALLGGEILVDNVDMRGWRMVAESLPDGRQSFPRFVPDADAAGGPVAPPPPEPPAAPDDETATESTRRIVTTVQFLRAHEGEFVYRDHNTPWRVVARNLDLTLEKREVYGGAVSMRGGTVAIRDFAPMTTNMDATYDLDGGQVTLTDITLSMDGFQSRVTGAVDLLNWPEQTYRIQESEIDLATMKDIFFGGDPFTATGTAWLTGTWHIYDGGRDLTGRFGSDHWQLSGFDLPDMTAGLAWSADRFEVHDYVSGFYDGSLGLRYEMAPLGADEPAFATLETTLADVDLGAVTAAAGLIGLRPEAAAGGEAVLRWPVDDFGQHVGEGALDLRSVAVPGYAGVPFDPDGPAWRVPVGGALAFAVTPDAIELAPSRLATPATTLAFEGRTAFGRASDLSFTVTSRDWQESDRLLSGVLTATGRPTNEVAVGGRGQMRGVMRGDFAAPRFEGRFDGESVQAWNVDWGAGQGQVILENGYLDLTDGVFDQGTSRVRMEGRFALGYPRADGGEEIDARFQLDSLPSQTMRQAFGIEGYEINAPTSGSLELHGHYRAMYGTGDLVMREPTAWGEPFDAATARLRFEGEGVRVDGLEMTKGEGSLTGAMFVQWDGTYSLNLDGRDIAMSSVTSASTSRATLGGVARFTASGAGAFEEPRYEVRGTIAGFAVNEQVLGQVTGRVDVRDGVMGVEVEAASTELAISGSGRVELTDQSEADLSFRLTNTTLDPFVRAYTNAVPEETSAVVSGTLTVGGPLGAPDALTMDARIEQLELELFDYAVANEGDVRLALDRGVVRVEAMTLVGDETELTVGGTVGLEDEQVAVRLDGDAGLATLQAFVPDLRSSGRARVTAEIGGTFRQPVVVGEAAITDGRIRHFSLPHGLDEIEGRLVFESDAVRFDDLSAVMAGGAVQFGGRVGLEGYALDELNVSAEGTGMNLRYPEGVRAVVDAQLTLGGDVADPVLSGEVTINDAIWLQLFEPSTGLLDFGGAAEELVPRTVEPTLPLRFDIRVVAPSSLRISDRTARVVASAELTVAGTYDQPLLFGNAEIDRGEVFFEGNRYRVTRGNIGFSDPTGVNPFLDVEAETDIRVPAQTYRVTLGVSGTMERLDVELSSDPPLQDSEILSLLLGDVRDPQAAELRSLRSQEESRQELLQAGAARLLTSPLSSGVGRVVEESFGVDSFEIAPSLSDRSAQQSAQLLPTARVLIGKRISDRAHVTFSRAVSGANQDLIIVVEYDQNDRLSWILSQNEDRTYALDFRVRHAF